MANLAYWVATGLSAYSAYAQGQQQKREAQNMSVERNFEAEQADQASKDAVAAAQRQAGEEKRRSKIMSSRAIALSAAGGGGATDPTIVNIVSDLEAEGSYRAAV